MMKYLLCFSFIFLFTSCATNNEVPVKSVEDKKADIYYGHGTDMLIQKDYTTALMHLQNAEKFRPDDTKILNNLGMAYYFKKDIENAIKYLKKAIDEDSKNSDARNNLASVYVNQGRLGEALEQYKRILNNLVYQHQYRTHYNMALVYQSKGDIDRAILELQKSVKINAEYCPAYYQLGIISTKQRQYKKSLDFFKKSTLGTCVNNPAPHYQQAISLLELNLHQQALIKLKEIIEQFPTSRYSILATRKLRVIEIERLKSRRTKMSKNTKSRNKKRTETKVSF
ncbi:tetratricopeptide repeat protein [Bacteriovoracaceae bacterium]|nr:tetratricopeptide repeat protein [Bacteriovoracaceae bacterium]